jgi:hypothetical protein
MDYITFPGYIKNPSGSRAMMVGEKTLAKQLYTDKYNKMMLRVNGKIDYLLYKKDNDRFIIYLKIPSESTETLFYDVVVEFFTKDATQRGLNKLDDYNIRMFSNDPNFIFTFAYVFYERGLIIPELKKKISKVALKNNPAKSNPNKVVGYVKSLYFTYLFMESHGLFNKLNWLNAMTNLGAVKDIFEKAVAHSDDKIAQAQSLKRADKKTKLDSIHKAEKDSKEINNIERRNLEIMAKTVGRSMRAPKVNNIIVKPIKKVGYVKKIKR